MAGSVRGFEEIVSPGPPFVHGATTILPPLTTPTAEAAIPSLGQFHCSLFCLAVHGIRKKYYGWVLLGRMLNLMTKDSS